MAHLQTVQSADAIAHHCFLSRCDLRGENVSVSRLRFLRLSPCALPSRSFLAGPGASLESAEQLRNPLRRAVEYDGVLSLFTDLSALAHALVPRMVLSAPPSWGRPGNALPGLSLDGKPPWCKRRWHRVFLQWLDSRLLDLAQRYCCFGVASLGLVMG